MSLCLISHKLVCKKCDKNISNENYAKLRNCLSKMKELDQIVLQEGLFAFFFFLIGTHSMQG